jgi:cytochrome c peroxidase
MKNIVLATLASTSLLLSASLQTDALNAGLKPIPATKAELMKIIDNPKNPITDAKVSLGEKLYFDPRLSKSGIISCNFCHNLGEGGDDGVEAAIGHKWTPNPNHVNSPTVYNAVFNDIQFWDGRAKDLEEQAQGPMLAHPEMASTSEHVVAVVTSIPEYVAEFKAAYGKDKKITFALIADTIGLYERTLVTPSAYDDYLNGDKNALNAKEKEGLKTFIDAGCVSCHTGVGLGGAMNMFNVTGTYKHMDVGTFKGDKNGMVRVPTLRNITQTAPYYHNGKIWNLKEAIKEMGKIQLGAKLSDKDIASIETFLKSLEGRKPKVIYPMLPASTEKTPRPDMN